MICKDLEDYLAAKENQLMEVLLNSDTNWNIISESDIKAKHYQILNQDLPAGYGVSTEWSIKDGRFDLVVIEKFSEDQLQNWASKKQSYKDNKVKIFYAVEYKIDDTENNLKQKQIIDFIQQIKRLGTQNLQRRFALFHYRGKAQWKDNPFNKDSEKYAFKELVDPGNLHIYYLDIRQKYRIL